MNLIIGQIGLGNPMGGILLFLGVCLLGLFGLCLSIIAIPICHKKKSFGIILLVVGITLAAFSGSKLYSFLPVSKPPPPSYTFNIELNETRDFTWIPADDGREYSRWLKDGFCPLSGDITAHIWHSGQQFSTENCRNMLVETKDGALSSVWFDEEGFFDRAAMYGQIKERKDRLGLDEHEFEIGMKELRERVEKYNSGDQQTKGAMGRWSRISFTVDGFVYILKVHRSFTTDEKYALRHVYKPNQSQPGGGINSVRSAHSVDTP